MPQRAPGPAVGAWLEAVRAMAAAAAQPPGPAQLQALADRLEAAAARLEALQVGAQP